MTLAPEPTTTMSIVLPVARDDDLLDEIAVFAMEAAQRRGVDAFVSSETASIAGAWRCATCGAWIELRDPMPWPDHCGQRADWVTSRERTAGEGR